MVKTGQPGFAYDSQGKFVEQAYRFTGVQPGFTQLLELAEQVVVMLTVGREEHLHQGLQARAPNLGRRRERELTMGNLEGIDQ